MQGTKTLTKVLTTRPPDSYQGAQLSADTATWHLRGTDYQSASCSYIIRTKAQWLSSSSSFLSLLQRHELSLVSSLNTSRSLRHRWEEFRSIRIPPNSVISFKELFPATASKITIAQATLPYELKNSTFGGRTMLSIVSDNAPAFRQEIYLCTLVPILVSYSVSYRIYLLAKFFREDRTSQIRGDVTRQ